MKKLLLQSSLTMFLGLFLTGCVGVIAIPECSNKPIAGVKLKSKDTEFIQKGLTSATEVINILGTNYVCNFRERALAYSWELPYCHGVTWSWWFFYGKTEEFDLSRWRAFFIAFDTNNIVIATATKHLNDQDTPLNEHLELWAIKNHAATNTYHSLVFPPK